MKVSVFLDKYLPIHENKDPGQLVAGLIDLGICASLICTKKDSLTDYKPNFPIEQYSEENFLTEQFWIKQDSDVIIIYSWFAKAYLPIIEKIKKSGKKIVIKADSDGSLGFPIPSRRLRVPLREELSIKNMILHTGSQLPVRFIHKSIASQKIRQISLADLTLIESPGALINLNFFLAYWGRYDLINKVFFVENPIAEVFLKPCHNTKENLIVAFGRLSDKKQKNTRILVETIVKFLQIRPDFSAVIWGDGSDTINSMEIIPNSLKERIKILGYIESEEAQKILSKTKIAFIPSRWESFCLAAAEALCSGCSIVGSPLESLQNLSMQGFSGTISPSFDSNALLAALITDSNKWDKDLYNAERIASFWQQRVNRQIVAQEIVKIINFQYKPINNK